MVCSNGSPDSVYVGPSQGIQVVVSSIGFAGCSSAVARRVESILGGISKGGISFGGKAQLVLQYVDEYLYR